VREKLAFQDFMQGVKDDISVNGRRYLAKEVFSGNTKAADNMEPLL